MILSASALRQAFLTHVSGELGSDFDQAFARHCPGSPEEISLPHAALILSDAVLGNPPFGIGETRLTSVALMVGGQTVLLDPPAAAIHPMLRDWAAPTIAEALRQPLMAGALMLDCVAGSPEFADVEITVRGSAGETVGFAHLRFPNAYALLCYGAVHPQTFPGRQCPEYSIWRQNRHKAAGSGR